MRFGGSIVEAVGNAAGLDNRGIIMCKQGTSTPLPVRIPAHLSRMGKSCWDIKDVDSCIATIVQSLNACGVITVASCCGHGKRPGNIALADGRELVIVLDYESGRLIDKLFPPINEPPAD